MDKHYDVLIIGAGPAGLFTAINSSGNNVKVALLEKNSTAGRKLLITGAGQCNLTHSGHIDEFFVHYGKNGKFLKSSFRKFSNQDLLNFFRYRGVDFIETPEGKMLPSSLKAQDILEVLLKECRKLGVQLIFNEQVDKVTWNDGQFTVYTKSQVYLSKALVIATGGRSYPSTGSVGDGYKLASGLGHTIVETRPALTPLYILDHPFSDLAGISFKDIETTLWRDNKKIRTWQGDVLITHRGLSGPGILNNSRYIEPGDTIRLNFVGAANVQECRHELDEIFARSGKQLVKNALSRYPLPHRLLDSILRLANISNEDRCAHLGKDKRNRLAEFLSSFPMKVDRLGDFNIAMVTKGGVNLKEIKPSNMESKLLPNLFFVGEVLDVDGDTGGYNLQAAFSEGYAAGKYINTLLS